MQQSPSTDGMSHTRDQKRMMRQALTYLKGCTGCLLADREFIGKEWMQFLLKTERLGFCHSYLLQ
mgnify:FL=1|jgi:hypothetical protein